MTHVLLVDELAHLLDPHHIVELSLLGLLPLFFLGTVVWFSGSSFSDAVRIRIVGWTVGGTAFVFTVATLAVYASSISVVGNDASFLLPVAADVGAIAGLVVGVNEARAIQHAEVSARAELSAEFAEAERVRLEHLNDLLRHDILNSVMVIQAMSELLLESVTDETHRDRLKRIRRQSDLVTELIQNVRILVQLPANEETLEAVDLAEVLTTEIAALKEAYSAATIDLTAPDTAYVRANSLVGSIFMNLVRNGIVHNDDVSPRVALTVAAHGDTVSVRIEDNGPGLPAYVTDTLFEQRKNTDHGLGLYLVKTLVDKYDGSISLDSTGDDGTVFTVTLAAANARESLTIEQ